MASSFTIDVVKQVDSFFCIRSNILKCHYGRMESPDMAERLYAEQRTREFLQTHCANLSMAEQLLRFKFDRTVAFYNIILQILFCCQFSDDFWMGKTYEQIDKKTAKSLPLEGAETPDGVASPHPSRFAARHPGEGFWQGSPRMSSRVKVSRTRTAERRCSQVPRLRSALAANPRKK